MVGAPTKNAAYDRIQVQGMNLHWMLCNKCGVKFT